VAGSTRTLRRQLLAWLAAPLVVLWSISGLVDHDIASRSVVQAYDRSLLESAFDIGRQVKVLDGQVYVDLPEVAVQMLQIRDSGRAYYLVSGADGKFITGDPDFPATPVEPSFEGASYYDDTYQGGPVRVVAVKMPVESGGYKGHVTVRVAENVAARASALRQVLLRMMLPQAVLILLAGVAVWYAVGRALAPLATLQRELATRSHRDLSPLSEQQAPEEVRPLIRAMNELLGRLSQALESQQRFIADAAHQLRTPVAGIKTQMELVLRQSPAGTAQATLKQLQAATEQTARLVNQLLSLARAEPGASRNQGAKSLDLARLARDTTTEWVPHALARNIDLGFDSPLAQAHVEGDSFMLREMLNNLLDNAVRYTQPGGQVTVRVTPRGRGVALCVEDNGPGIPDSERERVFERFHRILGTGAEGCGLGLAIVREIALSHGAEASLASGANDTGTLVRIDFPKAA
jgi:two-component system sensor histidine kinase TctE